MSANFSTSRETAAPFIEDDAWAAEPGVPEGLRRERLAGRTQASGPRSENEELCR